MKTYTTFSTAAIVLFLIAASGCQTPAEPAVLFQDKFEYTPQSPWTPPANGWQSSNSLNWSIVTGGVTGNALRFPPNTPFSALINDYSGSDCTVSVRFKPTALEEDWPVMVIGRADGDQNWYGVGVYEDAQGTYLICQQCISGNTSDTAEIQFKTGGLDSGTYYTLVISIKGNQVTGSCSGGGFTRTITNTLTSRTNGKVGVLVWTNSTPNIDILFDDFTVSSAP